MPFYYNTRSTVIRVMLSDGSMFGLPSRKDVFIQDDMVSAEIQSLVDNKILKYRGGASLPIAARLSEITQEIKSITQPADTVVETLCPISEPCTSNDIHDFHDRLSPTSKESIKVSEDDMVWTEAVKQRPDEEDEDKF